MTFSIVARDPQSGELGIAVQSKFLAVGAVVPWARAGVGAIATQSWANTSYGSQGLALLAEGLSAAETLTQLTSNDDGRASRQVGIVAVTGRACDLHRRPVLFVGRWAGWRTLCLPGQYSCGAGDSAGNGTYL